MSCIASGKRVLRHTTSLCSLKTLRSLVLKSLHYDMGQMGTEHSQDLIRKHFYWPKMSAKVETKDKICNRCIRHKTKAASFINIAAKKPLKLVCMDFLSVEPHSSNTKDILVITGHFTKYVVAVPTPNQKTRTVAKSLWDHFFLSIMASLENSTVIKVPTLSPKQLRNYVSSLALKRYEPPFIIREETL